MPENENYCKMYKESMPKKYLDYIAINRTTNLFEDNL